MRVWLPTALANTHRPARQRRVHRRRAGQRKSYLFFRSDTYWGYFHFVGNLGRAVQRVGHGLYIERLLQRHKRWALLGNRMNNRGEFPLGGVREVKIADGPVCYVRERAVSLTREAKRRGARLGAVSDQIKVGRIPGQARPTSMPLRSSSRSRTRTAHGRMRDRRRRPRASFHLRSTRRSLTGEEFAVDAVARQPVGGCPTTSSDR